MPCFYILFVEKYFKYIVYLLSYLQTLEKSCGKNKKNKYITIITFKESLCLKGRCEQNKRKCNVNSNCGISNSRNRLLYSPKGRKNTLTQPCHRMPNG